MATFRNIYRGFIVLFLLLPTTVAADQFIAERLNASEPIISAQQFRDSNAPTAEGANISGPSVIRIPDWIPAEERAAPSARYYLYFAHHHGDYIRLAWAENIEGPWQLYQTGKQVPIGERGVLDMGDARRITLGNGYTVVSHIASPDVHIDETHQRIILYFHGTTRHPDAEPQQQTYVATSHWGLEFASHIEPVPLARSYLRVFEYRGALLGLSPNYFHRALDVDSPWSIPAGRKVGAEGLWEAYEARFLRFPPAQQDGGANHGRAPYARHLGLYRSGDRLHVFFTMKKHSPERILVTTVDLPQLNWFNVAPESEPVEVLRAQRVWEGADLLPHPSKKGAVMKLVNALRDPFVFSDEGKLYLFYAGGGEQAIGLARLTQVPDGR